MSRKIRAPYTVTLLILAGPKVFERTFVVDAVAPREAEALAEHIMPLLPDSDPLHTDPEVPDAAVFYVVGSKVVVGDAGPAWRRRDGLTVFC